MLFAYAVAGEATLTPALIAALRAAAAGDDATAPLAFDWETLTPGQTVEGTFLRGYRHVGLREEALWIVNALRRFSARFPELTVYVSGGGALPMTQLRAGSFELFAEVYEQALAALLVDISPARTVRTPRT